MSLSDGTMVVRVADNGRPVVSGGVSRGGNALSEVYPDLSDPATVGCLLALVREAWQDPATGIYRHARRWCVIMGGRCEDFFADTEVEALVCALEAAP
jgi:hypothetical protein